jgi:hypothetical protein
MDPYGLVIGWVMLTIFNIGLAVVISLSGAI